MPDYLWICLYIPEYTRLCVNMAKYVWLNLVLHALIVTPCLVKNVVTYFNKVYSFKEHEVTILLSCRDFKRLKTFTGKISSFLFSLGVDDWELWISIS